MTPIETHISALQKLSRDLYTTAAKDRRWDGHKIRAHARTLDCIALDLLLEEDRDGPVWT